MSRVSQILSLFEPATPEVTAGEVAERLGLNRTTLYRYCTTLVAAGLLERSTEGGCVPGSLLLQLGAFAIGHRRVVHLAPRHMRALSRVTRTSAVLGLWNLTGPVVSRVEEDVSAAVIVSVRVDVLRLGIPFIGELTGSLARAGLDVRTYSDITPELPAGTGDAAAEAAREHRAHSALAIGGGSTLDAAKLIALLCVHGGSLDRYYGENRVPGPVLPVVAAPTTAGTRSEGTPVAVVSDPGRELKVGVSSPFLVPAAAVVDPGLTRDPPRGVTAFSGIDALVPAAESYTARAPHTEAGADLPVCTGNNALTEPVALRAAQHLGA
ncbi:iron-containing alcohol dehydrogenase [Streptomyces sp. enrichment culture]|uniref:iron-containing alcohol dehydrogenase n=1 Tax=Streptomyces sp. enrichment culture TaxID=1795815 RepID=UPI003F550065